MKAEDINDIITVDEYFEILAENELDNNVKTSKKDIFEKRIKNMELYPDFMTPAMQDIYSKYQRKMNELALKENRTELENNALEAYYQKPEQSKGLNDEQSRILTKDNGNAGYINATIILVMILNIGFIIAMALLGNK